MGAKNEVQDFIFRSKKWENILSERIVVVYINGHKYLFDAYGWKFLVHDESCEAQHGRSIH